MTWAAVFDGVVPNAGKRLTLLGSCLLSLPLLGLARSLKELVPLHVIRFQSADCVSTQLRLGPPA